MKILIVKPSSLGDVVQALPVAVELKKRLPGARVDWVVFEAYRDILQGHPALHTVYALAKPSWRGRGWSSQNWRTFVRVREEAYDIVLDLQGLLRSGIMTLLSGARRRIGLASAREGARMFYSETAEDRFLTSAIERYLTAVAYVTDGTVSPQPEYGLAALPDQGLPSPADGYWVIHPYTRWPTKLWPWRYYQTVADSFKEKSLIVIGNGPWFPLLGKQVIDLRNRLDIKGLISVLSRAEAVVSTDSGPAHLAAALDRPVIVLFGATDPMRTRPYGRQVVVFQRDLLCVPCMRRVCHNPETMECLAGIPPETVIEKLADYLS